MAQKKSKVVKVDGIGTVAFPSHFTDDDVAKAVAAHKKSPPSVPWGPQPKGALNPYLNPENQPPAQALAFNKGWSRPGPYITKLSPQQEQQFQAWVKQNKIPWQDVPNADYDMRGYWLALTNPNSPYHHLTGRVENGAFKGHFSDRWKTPYSGVFSRESMYALPTAPHWVGDNLYTAQGKLITDETPRSLPSSPRPKPQVVPMEGGGSVAFPHYMSNDQILNILRNYKATPLHQKLGELTTEQSEHQRQLVPARPLASELPTLPKWLSVSLPQLGAEAGQRISQALGLPSIDPLGKLQQQEATAFRQAHPIAGGIAQGASQFVKGIGSLENLALLASIPESKLMSALFTVQALRGSYKTAEQAKQAFKEGKNAEASNLATQAILNAGMGALAGAHAYSGLPEGVRTALASEEGSIGPQGVNPNDLISVQEAHRLFSEKAKAAGIKTEGAFIPSYESNYMELKEPLPRQQSAQGYEVEPSIRFSNHSPAQFRPTFANWQGGTREEFDKWANDTIQDIQDLRSGNLKAYEDRKNNKRFASLQKSADWWRANGNERNAQDIERDIEKQKKALGIIAPKELKPTSVYKPVDQSQPFYLKSENIIADKMKGPMPAEDVHKMLLSNGVKPDEMKYTGLDDFLKSKSKQKVTPQELKDQIAGSNLQLHEVMKGAPPEKRLTPEETQEMYHLTAESERRHLTPEERMRLDDLDLREEAASMLGKETRFGSYTLPGAEPGSYREMLVTMPPSKNYEELDPEIRKLSNWPQDVKTAKNPSDQAKLDQLNAEWERRFAQARQFKSSHWDEPNVIGHVRFNDRVGPNGEKILHLEELQSDWAQRGRKHGFGNTEEITAKKEAATKAQDAYDKLNSETIKLEDDLLEAELQGRDSEAHVLRKKWEFLKGARSSAFQSMSRARNELEAAKRQTVPQMPFSKTWPELLLKRMLKYAADHGYDGVSWTPGEEQAARYDLSKVADEVAYNPQKQLLSIYKGGQNIENFQGVSESSLPDYVGKDVAEKLSSEHEDDDSKKLSERYVMLAKELRNIPSIRDANSAEIKRAQEIDDEMTAIRNKLSVRAEGKSIRRVSGVDLKVGGQGMKGFYDKIIPDAANKLGKNWGAKVGETELIGSGPMPEAKPYPVQFGKWGVTDETGKRHIFSTEEEAQAYLNEMQRRRTSITVPYLPLNPQAKATIKSVPYSLFGIGGTAAAIGLQQVKQRADELQNQFRQAGLAR